MTLAGQFRRISLRRRALSRCGRRPSLTILPTSLRADQRRTQAADALIASTYLAGAISRRVRRALAAKFDGAIGKDVVSRARRGPLPPPFVEVGRSVS